MKTSLKVAALIILFNTLPTKQSFGQDTPVKKWHYLVEPYMMFSDMTDETKTGISHWI